MKYEEEKQARDLYEVLSNTFATSSPETDISIEGAGVHWNCFANRGDRICVIDCFGQMGYAVSFKTNTVTEAMGRTRLEKEWISAVSDWLLVVYILGVKISFLTVNFVGTNVIFSSYWQRTRFHCR